MISNEFLASEILGHGAYLCVRRSGNGDVRRAGAARISTLAERLQLRNEFDPGTPPSRDSIALLRRRDATKGDVTRSEERRVGKRGDLGGRRRVREGERVTEGARLDDGGL